MTFYLTRLTRLNMILYHTDIKIKYIPFVVINKMCIKQSFPNWFVKELQRVCEFYENQIINYTITM